MMNKKLRFLIIPVISYLFFSQAMAQSVTVNKNIENFDKVSLNSSGELFLKQGAKYSVKINADQGILSDLSVYKSGDTLNLGLKKSDYIANTVKFYVTMPNINAIKDNNSGIVYVLTDIKAKNLILSLQNSGHMTTKKIIANDNITVTLANSGTMSLEIFKSPTSLHLCQVLCC